MYPFKATISGQDKPIDTLSAFMARVSLAHELDLEVEFPEGQIRPAAGTIVLFPRTELPLPLRTEGLSLHVPLQICEWEQPDGSLLYEFSILHWSEVCGACQDKTVRPTTWLTTARELFAKPLCVQDERVYSRVPAEVNEQAEAVAS